VNQVKQFLLKQRLIVQEIFLPPSKSSPESLKLMVKSLTETASTFYAQPVLDWSHRFYQCANRLAHAFLLKELNDIPTRLLFIYFTGDSNVNGRETMSQWQIAIKGYPYTIKKWI
jgi:hypothetical protein